MLIDCKKQVYVSGSTFILSCVRFLKRLMPGADVPIQQCVGPFHSSVIPLLKLLMKIRDKHTTVQFKIGLLSPFGSFPPKFMNSGRACQLWTRRLWQNKFMNPIRNEQKRFHWFDGCASTNLCSLWSWWGREGGGVWRKFEKSTWEIYLWCAMDPEWMGLEVWKAAGCIHQHH